MVASFRCCCQSGRSQAEGKLFARRAQGAERETTRQRQARSKQYPARMKSDSETVLDVEMCGAVRYVVQ